MDHIQLSSAETEQLHQALLNAFPLPHQIPQLSQYGVGVQLSTLVGPTAGTSEKIYILIQYANAQGMVPELIGKAREMNHGNDLLKKAAGDFVVHEELEAIVREDPELFPNPEVLRDRMAERERAICRIETSPGLGGTGFLVGERSVLTCFHVMKDVINEIYPPTEVDIRFGNRILVDGEELKGDKFRLADRYLVASSPVRDMDFALLELSDAPEGKTLGTYSDAPKRRRIDLTKHQEAVKGNTIIALQHPEGDPLKVTFGKVTSIQKNKLTYDANTLPGSSGSPILLNDGTITALHRQGYDEEANAGIRISKIESELNSQLPTLEL